MFELIAITLANMGTKVMWHQHTHLFFGNAIIGVIEGLLLAAIFKSPVIRSILLLVVANYVSVGIGFALFGFMETDGPVQRLWPATIYNYKLWLVAAIAACFVLTIAIELPFVWGALTKELRSWRRALNANLLIQSLTYVTCIGLPYFWQSDVSLSRAVSIEPDEAIELSESLYWIYYISEDTRSVRRVRPDGSQSEHVKDAPFTPRSGLYVFGADGDKLWDLWVYHPSGPNYEKLLIEDLAPRRSAFLDAEGNVHKWDFNMHPAADFRDVKGLRWFVQTHDNNGIACGKRESLDNVFFDMGDEPGDFWLTFTTGLGSWKGRNATILPNDIVIFEFGGQICALDLPNRKLAMITRGHAPVVVPDSAD